MLMLTKTAHSITILKGVRSSHPGMKRGSSGSESDNAGVLSLHTLPHAKHHLAFVVRDAIFTRRMPCAMVKVAMHNVNR
jgi:hypothetical protein